MEKYKNIIIDKNLDEYIYIQIYNQLKKMIIDRLIEDKEKLPSISKLSKILNVNAVTIVRAYEELEKDNYLYKKIGSGSYAYYKPKKTEVKKTDTIDFSNSTLSNDLFPIKDIKNIINETLDEEGPMSFEHLDPQGDFLLRKTLKEYLSQKNIIVDYKDIHIISGAQQGIDLVSKAILNHDDNIIIESPTYTGALGAFKSRGVNIIDVNIDNDGMDIEKLEANIIKFKPKLLYLMVNIHNPTGINYSLNKKKEIANLAKKYNLYILEDDCLSDLNYEKNNQLSLKSLIPDNTIYIKSFSKLFLPGIRLGVLVAPKNIKNQIIKAKHISDISTSGLLQKSLYRFMEKGLWDKHKSKITNIYQKKFKYTIDYIDKNKPKSLNYIKPKGGLNIYFYLSKNININEILYDLVEKEVIVAPGKIFYKSYENNNSFRISVANLELDEIKKGLSIIFDSIKKNEDNINNFFIV